MVFPSGEHQHGGMAFESLGEHLRALHAQANAVILDGGKGGLRFGERRAAAYRKCGTTLPARPLDL